MVYMKTVQLSLDDRTSALLERSGVAPDEIFRLGLEALARRRELEAQESWSDSLPELELSEEERRDLAEAINEADAGLTKPMTFEEITALAEAD